MLATVMLLLLVKGASTVVEASMRKVLELLLPRLTSLLAVSGAVVTNVTPAAKVLMALTCRVLLLLDPITTSPAACSAVAGLLSVKLFPIRTGLAKVLRAWTCSVLLLLLPRTALPAACSVEAGLPSARSLLVVMSAANVVVANICRMLLGLLPKLTLPVACKGA